MTKLLTTALSAAVKVLSQIAKTWMPEKRHQIEVTADALESLAVVYFGLAAGDASKSVTKQEAETTFIKRVEIQPSTTTTTAAIPPTKNP